MIKGSGTRSGLLWEVERILKECKQNGELPQILLMENVPQVHSKENISSFQDWMKELEKLGYSNYWQDLNAKHYGIPQNRDRTFMVSILGDWYYEFPKKKKLKLKLKDILDDNVDEKYYLSPKQIENVLYWNAQQEPFNTLGLNVSPTLTTRSGAYAAGMVLTSDEEDTQQEKKLGTELLRIKEATKKGYAEAHEGDGVYINRPHQKRGVVQKGMIQTLKTSVDDLGVVIKVGNYSPSGHNAASIVDTQGIAPTVMENHGTITSIIEEDTPKLVAGVGEMKSNDGQQWYQQDRIYDGQGVANLPTGSYMYLLSNLRIRKLTPQECFKLMGLKDEDIKQVMSNQTDPSAYHLAGDSIVVNVLMHIFKELL